MEPTAEEIATPGVPASQPGTGSPTAPPAGERHADLDTDRSTPVGIMVGITMFFIFQGFILAAFQLPVISAEIEFFEPLRYAGLTQMVYAAPALLLFVNRKCPNLAKGLAIVTAVVFVGGIAAIALG